MGRYALAADDIFATNSGTTAHKLRVININPGSFSPVSNATYFRQVVDQPSNAVYFIPTSATAISSEAAWTTTGTAWMHRAAVHLIATQHGIPRTSMILNGTFYLHHSNASTQIINRSQIRWSIRRKQRCRYTGTTTASIFGHASRHRDQQRSPWHRQRHFATFSAMRPALRTVG